MGATIIVVWFATLADRPAVPARARPRPGDDARHPARPAGVAGRHGRRVRCSRSTAATPSACPTAVPGCPSSAGARRAATCASPTSSACTPSRCCRCWPRSLAHRSVAEAMRTRIVWSVAAATSAGRAAADLAGAARQPLLAPERAHARRPRRRVAARRPLAPSAPRRRWLPGGAARSPLSVLEAPAGARPVRGREPRQPRRDAQPAAVGRREAQRRRPPARRCARRSPGPAPSRRRCSATGCARTGRWPAPARRAAHPGRCRAPRSRRPRLDAPTVCTVIAPAGRRELHGVVEHRVQQRLDGPGRSRRTRRPRRAVAPQPQPGVLGERPPRLDPVADPGVDVDRDQRRGAFRPWPARAGRRAACESRSASSSAAHVVLVAPRRRRARRRLDSRSRSAVSGLRSWWLASATNARWAP